MIPINCKITMLDRNYIDGEIKKGRFASYGHCLRYFVHSDKVQKRELSKLRADNARLKGILEVVRGGQMGQETQQKNVGNSPYTIEDA